MSRVVAWFSCGAASAAAAYLALKEYGKRVDVVYCDTMASEHPDNLRFFLHVQRWLQRDITVIRSDKYTTVDEVFEQTRYMSGIAGARCTVEMKKVPRHVYQRPDDVHVFGFTADEVGRVERFTANNPELIADHILVRHGWGKASCLDLLRRKGIALPAMYALGYRNNNCIGCVKATSRAYWASIRRDFPDVFERRAKLSRELGVRLTRVSGERVFLDELPPDVPDEPMENISCGPECGGVQIDMWGGK